MVDVIDLPPGFRFHPTDEEVITHYLSEKILNHGFTSAAIGEADLNKCEPWDLPSKARMGEKEWFFFCQKDRKYPTGMRTNRATESGYWKATGKDKEIFRGKGVLVGMKKTLVFYKGRAPKGEKTNWVMHEFRIEGKPLSSNLPRSAKDEWVVNKVFNKCMGGLKKIPYSEELTDSSAMAPLVDPNYSNSIGNGNGNFEAFTSVASYYPPLMGTENSQFQSKGFIPNYNFQFPSQSPYNFPLAGVPADLGYFHAERAAFRPCKVEQFSNQSMISASQDTGMTTDPNMEISSVASKNEIRYGDLDDPLSSAGQDLDLGNMWDY